MHFLVKNDDFPMDTIDGVADDNDDVIEEVVTLEVQPDSQPESPLTEIDTPSTSTVETKRMYFGELIVSFFVKLSQFNRLITYFLFIY